MSLHSTLRVVCTMRALKILHLIYVLGIVRSPPRIFWKDHQHDFPTLARLARDVLSISATGAV
jgi:hypothetical protein